MDQLVFKEETNNLLVIQKKIDAIIAEYEKDLERYNKELEDFYVVEASDMINKQYYISQRNYYSQLVDEYTDYKYEPYFGRMDLSYGNKQNETFLIGKNGIRNNGKNIVFDWRSPVGSFFYLKTENEFHYNDYRYSLLLRRSYIIRNGNLIEYDTEYDAGKAQPNENEKIVDPFLLKLLIEKRKEKALTDIIATIQGNQNTIIRESVNKGLVVQGCAGSGKTMILLHRLSYLLFNNQLARIPNVKLITPNHNFEMHINRLSEGLGLKAIDKLTVEEFYISLIEDFSKKYKEMVYKGIKMDMFQESKLNHDLLCEAYSENFYEHLKKQYDIYWQNFINEFVKNEYANILKKSGIILPDKIENRITTCEFLNSNLDTVIRHENDTRVKIALLQNKKDEIILKVSQVQKDYGEIEQEKQSVGIKLKSSINNIEAKIELINNDIDESKSKLKILESSIDNLNDFKVNIQKKVEGINDFLNYSLKINGDIPVEIEEFLVDYCKNDFETYRSAVKFYTSIRGFNFIRKNRAYNDLEQAFVKLKTGALEGFSEYSKVQHSKVVEIDNNIHASEKRIATENDSLFLNEQKLKSLLLDIEQLEKTISVLNKASNIELSKVLEANSVQEYGDVFHKLIDLISNSKYLNIEKEFKLELDQIDALNSDINKLRASILSDRDYAKLLEIPRFINEYISIEGIYKNFFLKEIDELYNKYNEKYKNEYKCCRHNILLHLEFCTLFFRSTKSAPSFINIDEAQDLSVVEYVLIKKILGQNCILNIYGDINQNIYNYKGINDWNQIKNIFDIDCYYLDQNYRNTNEITEYCNEQFNMNVLPVGVPGDKVEKIEVGDLDILDVTLMRYKDKNVNDRVAVIYKDESVKDKLRAVFELRNVSWDSVSTEYISIISVEMSKGIEFDAVAVVAEGMSQNEQYVACTRALNKLFVI